MSNNGAESIEKTSKIAAIVVAVASVIGGILTGGLMGAIAGLLTGGALGFAFMAIGSACADVVKASIQVNENVDAAMNKISNMEKTFDNFDSDVRYILPEIKEEVLDLKEKVNKITVAPKEAAKKEEAAVPAEPVKVVESPKEESKKESEEEVKEIPVKKITFTPAPVQPKEEEKKSPFAASPFVKKEVAPKKEEAKSSAPKKGSLYKCEVCGNMVNATPCPRCAIKKKSVAAPVKETEEPKEEKSEKSAIWANATKPATADDLANKASAFKKPTEVKTEEIAAPTPEVEEAKPEVNTRSNSPFAASNDAPKVEAPAPAPAASKRGSLYRCDVCGCMVNTTPCPKCAIRSKSKRAQKADDAAPAPEAANNSSKEEKEDVNPIWAAATKPAGGSAGGSSGVKLMESSNSALAQTTWSSPLRAGATATEAPSWARPSASLSTANAEVEESPEEKPSTPSFRAAVTPAPKLPETDAVSSRPIWEKASDDNNDGATPNWMQNNSF